MGSVRSREADRDNAPSFGARRAPSPEEYWIAHSLYFPCCTNSSSACIDGAHAQNLLTNGDFEQGNTGFATGYTYVPENGTVFTVPGDYSVITNPATAFTNGYLSYGDHTTGSGLMFFADGAAPGLNVWSEDLNLAAGGYTFSGWMSIPDPSLANAATLAFLVNGAQDGGTFTVTEVGQWQEWTLHFNLTSGGNTMLSIQDTNPDFNAGYDDFTLDDLSLTHGTTPEPDSLLLTAGGLLTCICAARRRLAWRRI